MNSMEVDDNEATIDSRITHFIRYFMSHRSVTKAETISFYKYLFNTDSETGLPDLIHNVNGMIKNTKLKIIGCVCEVTSKEYWVLIPTMFKPNETWPGNYKNNELDYFQLILKAIMTSGDGTVSSIECLNLTSKISKTDAEKLIKKFIDDKYLMEVSGRIALSHLANVELNPYIEHYFEDAITSCTFCRKHVIYSLVCPNCSVRAHKRCFNKYKTSLKSKPKCPSCNKVWTEAKEEE